LISFIQTGQEDVIMGHDLPTVVEGVRRICAVSSTLLGNVTEANNAPANAPPPGNSALPIPLDGKAVLLRSMFVSVVLSLVALTL
jgi:hypothetical protein